jgi:hypothetical protein
LYTTFRFLYPEVIPVLPLQRVPLRNLDAVLPIQVAQPAVSQPTQSERAIYFNVPFRFLSHKVTPLLPLPLRHLDAVLPIQMTQSALSQ